MFYTELALSMHALIMLNNGVVNQIIPAGWINTLLTILLNGDRKECRKTFAHDSLLSLFLVQFNVYTNGLEQEALTYQYVHVCVHVCMSVVVAWVIISHDNCYEFTIGNILKMD